MSVLVEVRGAFDGGFEGAPVPPTGIGVFENRLPDQPGGTVTDRLFVAVFGTDHDRWGEAVTAAVVPGDETPTLEDIEAWWAEHVDLADYKRPRRLEVVDQFPRTATQKVDKVALKERVTE